MSSSGFENKKTSPKNKVALLYKKSKRRVAGVPRVAEADCDVNVLNVANLPFSRGDVSSFARRDVGR